MKTPRDPRDLLIGYLILLLGLLVLLCLVGCLTGRARLSPETPYAELADRMNAPELARSVHFESDETGSLLCYIDAVWRAASPNERRHFALRLATDWAHATGNPHALVALGTGHGTFWAFAAAHDARDGRPFYRALADYQ